MKLYQKKFETEIVPDQVFMIGGHTPIKTQEFIRNLFGVSLIEGDKIFHYSLHKLNNKIIMLIFNVYGSSMVADLLHYIADGGCQNVIFIGYAYSRNVDDVNKIMIIDSALTCDGLSEKYGKDFSSTYSSLEKLKDSLNRAQVNYSICSIASGGSIFYKPDNDREIMKAYSKLVDMETASVFCFSKVLNLNCSALMLVNETDDVKIYHDAETKTKLLPYICNILVDYYEI